LPATLRAGGLAARTIGDAHRVLGKALRDAEDDNLITRNVRKLRKPPKVAESEMVFVRDVPGIVKKLNGERLWAPAIVALFTGMRLGEILALRERRVDFDRGVIEVRKALEETKAHGIRFKAAKTKAGRRDITLPDIALQALREHRKRLLETRVKLGLGKLGDDDLLFANLGGSRCVPAQCHELCGRLGDEIDQAAW
jgi:integrase